MSFTVCTMPQRSDAWRAVRLGRLTGSSAADMLASIKSGEAASRRDLRLRLVCERLTQQPAEDGYVSPAMLRGVELEDDAVAAYEALTGALVMRTGFLAHDVYAAGTSLDGHIGDFEGVLEVKCPKSATHLSYLRAGVVPSTYTPQLLHHLWISGAAWADFLSYDPRFPPPLQTFVIRFERNEAAIRAYAAQALAFLAEVDAELKAVVLERPEVLCA